jgi:hypothetical protein
MHCSRDKPGTGWGVTGSQDLLGGSQETQCCVPWSGPGGPVGSAREGR